MKDVFDLALLGLPIFAGWWIKYSILDPLTGTDENAHWSPPIGEWKALLKEKPIEHEPVQAPDEQAIIWKEIMKDANSERMAMAWRALDAIPDISTDRVAEVLGLNKMKVRRLGNKGRAKGKNVTDAYSRDEILLAAQDNVMWN